MSYRVVPNRTPPPLLVPIRPPYPERSSATGFVAIAGGIVIGCQMRARPPLNLPKLRHVESERRLLRFEKPAGYLKVSPVRRKIITSELKRWRKVMMMMIESSNARYVNTLMLTLRPCRYHCYDKDPSSICIDAEKKSS